MISSVNPFNKFWPVFLVVYCNISIAAYAGNTSVVDSLKNILQEIPPLSSKDSVLNSKEDTTYLNTLTELALELVHSNPDTSMVLCTKALELSEKNGYEKGIGNASQTLGIITFYKGNYTLALDYFQKSLALWEKLDPPDGGKVGAYNLINTGNVYSQQGDYHHALDCFNRSLEINEKLGDENGVAITLGNMGNVYKSQGDFSKALDHHFEALKIKERLGSKPGVAVTLSNIGTLYNTQAHLSADRGDLTQAKREYSKSLEYFFRSLEIDEELGEKHGIGFNWMYIGTNYEELGELYLKKGDHPQAVKHFYMAWEYYHRALNLHEEVGYKMGVAANLENIGNLYRIIQQQSLEFRQEFIEKWFSKENEHQDFQKSFAGGSLDARLNNILLDSAISCQRRAYGLRQEMNDKQGIASSLSEMGSLLIITEKYAEAISLFEQAYTISDSIGALPAMMAIAKKAYRAYKTTNNTDKALEWHEIYIAYRDSISNKEQKKEIGRMEAKAEFDKQQAVKETKHLIELEKQEAIASAERKRQNVIIMSVSLGLISSLIFAVFIFSRLNITRKQKKTIENQKLMVEDAYKVIEANNKNITDSINYAKSIQSAILMRAERVQLAMPFDTFILYQPKDIVSGDFYWFKKKEDKYFIAIVDCTGHGVPGGFMSIIGNSLLNEIVNEKNILDPSQVLQQLDALVVQTLGQDEKNALTNDGMEIAFCVIDAQKRSLKYAGSGIPLFIAGNGKVNVIKADYYPIGGRKSGNTPKAFRTHEIELSGHENLYLSSDGFIDQFGTDETGKRRKLGRVRFMNLLENMNGLEINAQKNQLQEYIYDWKGEYSQIDDMLVMGINTEKLFV